MAGYIYDLEIVQGATQSEGFRDVGYQQVLVLAEAPWVLFLCTLTLWCETVHAIGRLCKQNLFFNCTVCTLRKIHNYDKSEFQDHLI